MHSDPARPAHSLAAQAYAFALALFLLDQASKYWILEVFDLPAKQTVPILPFFNLTMVWNRGVSMGLFEAGSDTGRWLLTGVTALISIGVAVWIWREKVTPQAWALAAVLGGALGNIVDRIRFGAVADFIHLHALGYSFYVFNVADAAITLGVAALLLLSFRSDAADRDTGEAQTERPK